MSGYWEVMDAADWSLAGEEPEGLRPHPWLRHPDRERTWLFKETEVVDDHPLHEDLAEKLASEIARTTGIPAARVELAQRHGKRGCLVEDVRWSGGGLQPGAVLLSGIVDRYDIDDRGHKGHSVSNIRQGLISFGQPPQAALPTSFTAFDVFAGYLVFDALIANTDRHEQNWAVLTRPPGESGPDALCASYDHASSLGFNLSDADRERRLQDGTVESWARGGKARQFERTPGAPIQTLVELASVALTLCAPAVRDHWLTSVDAFSAAALDDLLSWTPGLSAVSRTFTREMIMINRSRILDAH